MGPTAAGRAIVATSLRACAAGADCMTIVVMSGSIAPPPRPWSTRKPMRLGTSHAAAHSTEPSRKTASDHSQSRFAPSRPCNQPTVGMTTPSARR
ncbi:hypothetical protein GA0115246_1009110 [Streptomyces sp. SolWspMP-sol7th]|nr:hypothetical protein GA0115246_1009110 [Streptomyces sp. SolWspMP-sol7th]